MRAAALLMALGALLVLAACAPKLGDREALPTAAPGVVDRGAGTPGAWVGRAQLASGPTPTPAPWATPLPPTPRPAGPKMTHRLQGQEQCWRCHRAGAFAAPADHRRRQEATCTGCHSVDYNAIQVVVPAIPHALEGRDDCLRCHLVALDGAQPMPGEHTGRAESTCRDCHRPG